MNSEASNLEALGLVGALIALMVAGAWIVFPFLVDSRLRKLISEVNGLRSDLAKQAGQTAAVPPMPGAEAFYVAKGKDVSGPHSRAKIEAMIEGGLLKPGDYVCRGGDTEWRMVSQFFPQTAKGVG
jgi:hypothetical protein